MATKFEIDLGISSEETYSINDKSLKFDSELDIQPYLTEMGQVAQLKKIDFAGNTIGIDASKLLAEKLLESKDSIVEINFADFFTGRLKDEIPKSLEYLLPALLQMPNLKVLNLSDNAFGLQTIDPIEVFLPQLVSLEHLILSNNGMGPFAGERIGKLLYHLAQNKKLKGSRSLKTFYCGRNRLENGSINYLAIGLRSHADLESVRLYQNGIRPEGIKKLIDQGLKYNSKLKVLDLQDNTFTLAGSKLLLANINSWELLEELNVNDCLLNPKGSNLVIEALAESKLTNLQLLKLQYNELEKPALQVLLKSLSRFGKLSNIELNGNRFEEEEEEISQIQELLESRGGELDELDDLEEIDSEEEEEEEEESEETEEEEEDLDVLEKELAQLSVSETPADKSVDDLASDLQQTKI